MCRQSIGVKFLPGVEETLNHMTADELTDAFVGAISG